MDSFLKKKVLGFAVTALTVIGASTTSFADVDVPPFYAAVMEMKAEGKLGQIVSKEKYLRQSKALRPGELPIFPRISMIVKRFPPAY